LGLAAMIPLRRLLIVREHDTLPYPEGTACAEVLRATAGGPDAARGAKWIFWGIAVGAAVQVVLKAGFLMPSEIGADVLPAYLRSIGAGAVAAAGILTVVRNFPAMAEAFLGVARGLRGSRGRNQSSATTRDRTERTGRDLPAAFTLAAVALVVAVTLLPGVL